MTKRRTENQKRLFADARLVAERLVAGRTSVTALRAEYRCSHEAVREALLTVLTGKELQAAFRRSRCNRTSFVKGRVAWNKGMKGRFCGPSRVQYKKGQIRGNAARRLLAVGAIVIRCDRTKRPKGRGRKNAGLHCRWIKVEGKSGKRRWVRYAHYLWERNHGPIPRGYSVVHLDGDSMNDDPSNLACLNHAENIKRLARLRPRRFQIGRVRAVEARRERCRSEREASVAYGPLVTHWECASCGADFRSDPGSCPKCGGSAINSWSRRRGVEQRLIDHANEQEETDTDD